MLERGASSWSMPPAWRNSAAVATAEWSGFCRERGQRYRVRLIASKLPPAKVAAARRRKATKAKKAKRKLTPTTLDASWPATEVLRLYQARWQIELVCKRIKQLLRLAPLRCQKRDAVEVTVRAILIAWALQEQVASEVRVLLPSGACDPHNPANSWLLAALSVQTLRQQVRGSWNVARLRACLAQLGRFLVTSLRKPRQAEADIRQWLEERSREAQPLLEGA